MPGVPDFYQGCEDWTIHPDRSRQSTPGGLRHTRRIVWRTRHDAGGTASRDLKMRITNALLDFRADHGRMLREAGYRPLRVRGSHAASVVAFERKGFRSRVVVAVPRLTTPLPHAAGWPMGDSFWRDTEIRLPRSNGGWVNPLTGEQMVVDRPWCRMAALTERWPWVVLARDEGQART